MSAEPEVYIYKKAFLGKKGNIKDYLKEAYINYYIRLRDKTSVNLYKAG